MKHGDGGRGGVETAQNSTSDFGNNEQFKQPDIKIKMHPDFSERN